MRALRAGHRLPAGCAFIVGLLLLVAVAARAQVGGMLVAPTRIVFEGDETTAALTLVNRGQTAETYRVSFVQRRMRDDGGFEPLESGAGSGSEPGQGAVTSADESMFADAMIVFSPRAVTLEPGQQQTIRLQLRKPAALDGGEYRSHLLIRAVPDTGSDDVERLLGAPKGGQHGLALQMTPVYGLTLPVIVRHGALSAHVAIEEVASAASLGGEAKEGADKPSLSVHLARSGDRSVFGNVVVDVTDSNGFVETVGAVNGVAVYTPNRSRTVVVPLDMPERPLSPKAKLRVRYIDRESVEGAAVLAEMELDIEAVTGQ